MLDGSMCEYPSKPEAFLTGSWKNCGLTAKCELYKREAFILGSAEIRVFGNNGHIFAGPDLIFHYMQEHHYLPPDIFVQAVMTQAGPSSPDYIARVKALSLVK